MKALIMMVVALMFGAGLMWVADVEPGFVLLQYSRWSLETSLIVFVVIFTILLMFGYIALRSWVILKQTPRRLLTWNLLQKHKRAGKALARGLISLEEGRWTEAEHLLVRYASNSETPLLHYLSAARAAQKQNAFDRRDNYLSLADKTTAGANIAVRVVQAELQIAAGQKEQALATLHHLREMAPKHPYVLQLLQQLYSEMNQWQNVQSVLPDLRKRKAMASSDVAALFVDAVIGQMQTALKANDWQSLESIWQQTAVKKRQSESVLALYVTGLKLQNKLVQACALIEDFLRKNWSDQLVYQYGLMAQDHSLAQLALAEKWLKNREEDPWLLLTLGRLSKANALWAKAEEYLHKSIQHGARGETYQILAEVLAVEGKDQQVVMAYQKGLALMLSQNEMVW